MQDAIAYLSEKDARLKAIVQQYGLPEVQLREQGFAALCHIILEQQVSVASAKAAYAKLLAALGQITPIQLLNAPTQTLRDCGISRQKTVYLYDLAAKVASGALHFESFPHKDASQIKAELLSVKGVGNWTVEVYFLFCLQMPDIIPLGDIAIKNTIKELFDLHSPEQMQALSENWRPHRSMATYILWHYYLKKRNRS